MRFVGAGSKGGSSVQRRGEYHVFESALIDFTAAPADYSFAIATGLTFFIDQAFLACTVFTSQTIQPTIRYGKTGSLAFFSAAAIATDLTAISTRQWASVFLSDVGVTTAVTAGITISGAGVAYQGRFAIGGFLI